MAKYWIVPSSEFPATQQSLDDCAASGAGQVLHGIPLDLEDVIPAETLGFFEVADTEPPLELPSAEVIATQAIHDEISSRLDEAITIDAVKLAITEGLDAALAQLG